MQADLIQIISIVIVIIVFGVGMTLINLRKKDKTPAGLEQNAWQKIEQLNSKKKELQDKKKEESYKYTAKTINDQEYNNFMKIINEDIEKIDSEINSEIAILTKLQSKNTDVDSDIRFTNIKIKGELSEYKQENKNLKEKINELEGFIKEVSKNNNSKITSETDTALLKYYELILNKYRDEINEHEKKTISEIKDMVRPTDLTIKSIVAKYQPIGYDFNKDYITTIRLIYNYLKSEVEVIRNELKILFWIDYSNVIKNKIADEQDISIIFCSCMQALMDENARVEIIMLEDERIHAFIKTKYKNTFYIFDLTQRVPFDTFKNIDEKILYQEYNFNGQKITKRIYAYNQYEYTDYRAE